jgi:hypothetical protein
MPAGTDEANLQVAVWDETKNQWVQVEGAVVDAVHHVVTVKLSHFSTYALMIKKPASFEYSELNVSPGEVTLQEGTAASFNITVSVTNSGGYGGNQTLVLKINDKETAKQEITIEPGMSQNVTFQETENDPGTYRVDVNGQTGQFIVKPRPATFKVTDLALSAPEIVSGSNATALESQPVVTELPKEPPPPFDWRIIGIVLLLGLVGIFLLSLIKRKKPASKTGDKTEK